MAGRLNDRRRQFHSGIKMKKKKRRKKELKPYNQKRLISSSISGGRKNPLCSRVLSRTTNISTLAFFLPFVTLNPEKEKIYLVGIAEGITKCVVTDTDRGEAATQALWFERLCLNLAVLFVDLCEFSCCRLSGGQFELWTHGCGETLSLQHTALTLHEAAFYYVSDPRRQSVHYLLRQRSSYCMNGDKHSTDVAFFFFFSFSIFGP